MFLVLIKRQTMDEQDLKRAPFNFTQAQYAVHMTLLWINIVLFTALLVIVVLNSWQILLKQGKWRTRPLLIFYVMALLSVVLRLIVLFCQNEWSQLSDTCMYL